MVKEKVFVVIPAYNESKHVSVVVKGVKKYINDVIVVDDGSLDNTSELARKSGAVVLRHVVNLGKGAGLKTGCDFALKKGAEKIIVIDADTQHDPNEIPNFLKALKSADIVFSQRAFNRSMPFVFRFGNWFIDRTVKFLFGMTLKDTQCGYRAFTADAYRKIRWKASDYSMESEMIANAGKNRLKYKVVPIKTIYTDKYKGTTALDGVKIVLNMIKWRLFK